MSDYASRAQAYAENVVSGRIIASELTILACQRHLEDLERAESGDPEFPYCFDPVAANRVCGFIEEFPHVKGEWAAARMRIKLEDWQCFVVACPFGWLERETGYRRFRTVYIEVPRKNAKTTLSAPIALYMLTVDGEQGAEVVSAATKRDQAKISFGIARSMVRKTEAFRTEFSVLTRALSIICMETDSVFNPIDSQGSTQDGANLHFALNDELHAWKGRELYGVLETAMGSRAQPMMWNITTAGKDQSGVCYEQRLYLIKILRRVLIDETLFGVIYTIDKDDDIFEEATHRKANPNYGVSCLERDMRALATKAKNNPQARSDFEMKRLNVWVNAGSPYFELSKWDDCSDPALSPDQFVDHECIGGLDLATEKDMNAGIRLIPVDGVLNIFADFWLPEAAIQDGLNSSYPGWVHQGLIHVTDGDVIDYNAIQDWVLEEVAEKHVLVQLGYDPYQATHLARNLTDQGIECLKVGQTVPNFSPAMKMLKVCMAKKQLRHNGNPILRWMLSNVVAKEDFKENVFPRKDAPANKIDGVIALLIAFSLWLDGAQTEEHVEGRLVAL